MGGLNFNDFYPRSPCGERQAAHSITARNNQFLSTLSLRRATFCLTLEDRKIQISIHALLAESDALAPEENPTQKNFYPRSPCGERLTARIIDPTYGKISIHALLAESDNTSPGPKSRTPISIHALLAESDAYIQKFDDLFNISIHALLAESDGHPSHIPWR